MVVRRHEDAPRRESTVNTLKALKVVHAGGDLRHKVSECRHETDMALEVELEGTM